MVAERRGFLRGLVSLPLIGGSLSLIGSPTAAAVPLTRELLEGYKTWLHYEDAALRWEMAGMEMFARPMRPVMSDSTRQERFEALDGYLNLYGNVQHAPWDSPPSGRAAAILCAAGVSWQERRRR